MNLILLKSEEVSSDGKSCDLSAKDNRSKHILGHLRKRRGDKVSVGIIGSGRGKAVVEKIDGGALRLALSDVEADDRCGEDVTLLVAMPFPKRLKALWAVAASFGVCRIVVLKGELSDKDHCSSSALQPHVYEKLVVEGMSQGGHTTPVKVHVDVQHDVSKDSLHKLAFSHDAAKIFLDCGDEQTQPPPARQVVLDKLKPQHAPKAIIAVGPERGWTQREAEIFHDSGFHAATLGPSILRVDTAVVASLAIVTAALQEATQQQQQQQKDDNANKRTKLA
uniref:16S rRNA (uracil(1498)-N(3))-methyltransferase n=1 Tax=Helicotheca tamesis TaxID=374047 RepID=A0A7S2H7G6_9STRA|mmetsp:Transcript_15840/g.21733  ORF Transcript_15840/g.21733 Transcript_15840/m.21733 type:complete len:279 (+) Transcript_15840:31-867(+)